MEVLLRALSKSKCLEELDLTGGEENLWILYDFTFGLFGWSGWLVWKVCLDGCFIGLFGWLVGWLASCLLVWFVCSCVPMVVGDLAL